MFVHSGREYVHLWIFHLEKQQTRRSLVWKRKQTHGPRWKRSSIGSLKLLSGYGKYSLCFRSGWPAFIANSAIPAVCRTKALTPPESSCRVIWKIKNEKHETSIVVLLNFQHLLRTMSRNNNNKTDIFYWLIFKSHETKSWREREREKEEKQ